MAVNVSNEFRQTVYSGESLYNCYLTINGTNISSDLIQSIKINRPIIDTKEQSFYIGTFISDKVEIAFKNTDAISIASGMEIALSISLEVDGDEELVNCGTFIIDELTDDYYKKNTITAYDDSIKMSEPVNAGIDTMLDAHYDAETQTTTYSTTLETFLTRLCARYNITIGSYPNVNNDTVIGNYDSTISGKQYISWIAEMMGGNAKIGRDRKLYILPLISQPVTTIDATASSEFTIGEKYEISGVTYFDAIRNFTMTAGDETDNVLVIRQNNLFVTSQEDIDNIFNAVDGFTIYNVSMKNYGDISLDAYDIVTYQVDNVSYNSYYDNTITYKMSVMADVNVKIPNKQQEITTNTKKATDEVSIRKIYSEIDQVNQTATIAAETASDSMAEVTSLSIRVGGIENMFQITGGNNLIKNSQFLLTDAFWNFTDNGTNPYHTELGQGYDGELVGITQSCAKIRLRNIIMASEITNINNLIAGQTYTLNYYYTQDDNTTTTVELINNITGSTIWSKVYDEEQSTLKNETYQFDATNAEYIFKVTTSTISGSIGYFNLYDLMLNSGDKKNWEPASSEVYSTVLKMSQLGLQVFATGSKTLSLLNSMGFAIYKSQNGELGEKITDFTDTGIVTGIVTMKQAIIDDYIMKTITINNKKHYVEYFGG